MFHIFLKYIHVVCWQIHTNVCANVYISPLWYDKNCTKLTYVIILLTYDLSTVRYSSRYNNNSSNNIKKRHKSNQSQKYDQQSQQPQQQQPLESQHLSSLNKNVVIIAYCYSVVITLSRQSAHASLRTRCTLSSRLLLITVVDFG